MNEAAGLGRERLGLGWGGESFSDSVLWRARFALLFWFLLNLGITGRPWEWGGASPFKRNDPLGPAQYSVENEICPESRLSTQRAPTDKQAVPVES